MTSETKVIDWIAHHGRSVPNDRAQVDLASGRVFTYSQMNDRVGRVAAHLLTLGVKPGDRVAFLALNSTDIFEISFGCWRIGAICLALNFRLTAPELEYIVNDAEPVAIFVDREFAHVASELRSLTNIAHWIETDGMGGTSEYEAALASATPILKQHVAQILTDQCMLMYSSGTTGRPKGVIITHNMMLYSAINLIPATALTRHCTNLAIMPLFHIGGFNIFGCPAFYAGASNVIMRNFDPGAALDIFSDPQLNITHFLGVPAIYNALKLHPKNADADLSRLQAAFAGAEAVPDALVQWWYERGVKIQEGYGMTESAASNCSISKDDVPDRIGSAGKAAMHTEMMIALEDGSEAAPGELGEIWMRGPAITPGYWNKPEANAECFVDGWFRSGDIGRCDAEGYFTIEDRVKDMYISGGENVYPAEIENILYEIEEIAEVAVIGLADEKWGETGCAVVALKAGCSLEAERVVSHCASQLAKFKHPRDVVFVEELPRNATGKVLKYQLRETIAIQLKSGT